MVTLFSVIIVIAGCVSKIGLRSPIGSSKLPVTTLY
jgi:hypothetical protein